MCYSDLGPARPARADPRQQAPRHVPVDVLALPRRRVDRRLHDRLSDGNAAMSPESTPGHAAHPHEIEMQHASLRAYLIGFAPSVVLTAIPFWLVMTMPLSAAAKRGKAAGTT